MENEPYRTIPVFVSTKDRLCAKGKKGETFDELVNRILDVFEEGEGRGRES